tara:strand:+ start:241 stop:666 length:426 start_codon:yes stop_codon:yes gene_type:complete
MATVFKRNLLMENVKETSLGLTSTQVTRVTRRLRTSWTPELAQDLDYYTHNYEPEEPESLYKKMLLIEKYVPKKLTLFDIEVELTNMLSRNLAQEIDREILDNLINIKYQPTAYKRKLLIELYSPQKFISPRVAGPLSVLI